MAITSKLLSAMCPKEWVAKAYSEYLAAVAEFQSKFLAEITDIASDEDLESVIEQDEDIIGPHFEYLDEAGYATLLKQGILRTNVVRDSAQFENALNEWFSNADETQKNVIKGHINNIIAQSTTVWLITPPIADNEVPTFFSRYVKKTVDSTIASYPSIQDAVNNRVDAWITSHDIHVNSVIMLNDGYYKIHDVMKSLTFDTLFPNPNNIITLAQYNPSGIFTKLVDTYGTDVFEELKGSISSAIAWSQGFGALLKNNLSEALASYEAGIANIISDTTERFAGIVNTVKNVLASTNAVITDFFATAEQYIGMGKIVADQFTLPKDTPLYDYTGASPLSGLSLETAKGLGIAIGTTILGGLKALWIGIKNLTIKGYNKARPYLQALTNNPEDIVVADSNDESYAIDNYTFQCTNMEIELEMDLDHGIAFDEEFLNKIIGQWYAINTYFAEITFRFNSAANTMHDGHAFLTLYYDMKMRPKCLNYYGALNAGVVEIRGANTLMPNITYSDYYIKLWEDFFNSGDVYMNDDAAEEEKYMGFAASLISLIATAGYGRVELDSQILAKYNWKFNTTAGDIDDDFINHSKYYIRDLSSPMGDLPVNVTNLDFIKLCSGFNPRPVIANSTFDLMYFYSSYVTDADRQVTMHVDKLFGNLFAMIIYQQYDKMYDPGDYLFLPYCKDTYNFTRGRYHIRTDSENLDIANTLANGFVVAVVVAAAIIISVSLFKIIKAKRIAKLAAKQGVMDNSMWNGKKLTTLQALKYQRYKNKIAKLESAGAGLAGTTSTIGTLATKVSEMSRNYSSNTTPVSTLEDIKHYLIG